ncbi:MAG TPA: hypothetical protein VJ717_16565 [Gemmatimonadaceae bacterium]|nr:hypothetical protein [Gemmatimonadaceae bacterium]
MAVIVILSGTTAFLSSVALLSLGVEALTLRYPIATIIGYGVFLLCLRIWVLWREPRTRSELAIDLPIDSVDLTPRPDASVEAFQGFGGCGGFSGGGASATIDSATSSAIAPSHAAPQPSADIDLDWDAEGLVAVPMLLVALLLSGAAFYVVATAPVLFAELLVDALVVAGVYRRMRRLPARHWFVSSLTHSWRPFSLLFVVTLIASMILQSLAPSADSIGDVFSSER